MFIAPAALILRCAGFARSPTFGGLGLSSLSFIYPDLQFGPADFQFWVFWIAHVTIIGSAFYDVTARGFRPNWQDWRFAVASALVYVAIIFPFDWSVSSQLRLHRQRPHGPAIAGQFPRPLAVASASDACDGNHGHAPARAAMGDGTKNCRSTIRAEPARRRRQAGMYRPTPPPNVAEIDISAESQLPCPNPGFKSCSRSLFQKS